MTSRSLAVFFLSTLLAVVSFLATARAVRGETLPLLQDGQALDSLDKMWSGFDPQAEPLDVENLLEWEQEGVVLRIVRFRIGTFKGKPAKLAGVYGFPKGAQSIPGLLQIHGGGQYADYKACLTNAKRGYATLSIAWAGRISSPSYQVTPDVVKLFWEGKAEDPRYRLTTDWGALDGYHAPSRNPGNAFPSAAAAAWTLDPVESPRNSGWFLGALAARRALTFLERQPEVDRHRLGVYGHSMGGKLSVLTAIDPRVKAAAPSCGGISDLDNPSQLFQKTLGDDVSLKRINCPIIFLSPANDFHGRIGDLPAAIDAIGSPEWRVTCSPHHNHQDTAPYEVATQLWFDQHLRAAFEMPETPEFELKLKGPDGNPQATVRTSPGRTPLSVDVFYTQQGDDSESSSDRENTVHRFWRHASADSVQADSGDPVWQASLPLGTVDRPLWVYANVTYKLEQPVTGAGYYYRVYSTHTFNLSSLLHKVTATQLKEADVQTNLKPSLMIESFEEGWGKEWFTYRPEEWSRTTNKLYDPLYRAPPNAELMLDVRSGRGNQLIVQIDGHAAEVSLSGGDQWQEISLAPHQLRNFESVGLSSWQGVKQLTLGTNARLRSAKPGSNESRVIGGSWRGGPPRFRNLRWSVKKPEAASAPVSAVPSREDSPIDPAALLSIFPKSAEMATGGKTSMRFDYSPSESLWDERLNERAVFLAEMSHEQDPGNSFQLRMGRGGQIYSLRSRFGESVPPSWRPPGNHVSPWNDEVWQFVAVCTRYNGIKAMEKIGEVPESFAEKLRDSGYQDSFFIHNSGSYIPGHSELQSLYCPLLAMQVSPDGKSLSMVNWGLVPQIRTIHRSPLLYYTNVRDVGNGVIEMTWVIHNFSQRDDIVFDHLNAPWGGTRISSLPLRYVSSPEGGLLEREGYLNQHGVVDVRKTGGWNLSCASDDPNSPCLALVYGRDRHLERERERKEAGEPYCQFDHSFYRDWRAQEPAYRSQWKDWQTRPENSFRNYDVCEIIPKLRLTPRSTIWFRSFLVVGDRDRVRGQAAELVDRVDYGLLDFDASTAPVAQVRVSQLESGAETESEGDAVFGVLTQPVSGTRPLFLIENKDTKQRIVTTDPYYFIESEPLGIDPPSSESKWDYYRELRGYAMDRHHSRWLGLVGYAYDREPDEANGDWRKMSDVLGAETFPAAEGHHREVWVRRIGDEGAGRD